MTHFTPLASLVGGGLIGVAAAILLLSHGRIAGISGILGGLLGGAKSGDAAWRLMFLIGLLGSGLIAGQLAPQVFRFELTRSTAALIAAGLLVGFGTRMGGGCTSGHGVCGISRLSKRSVTATATFMATGAITVFLVRALFGGAL